MSVQMELNSLRQSVYRVSENTVIPAVGLGTFQLHGTSGYRAIKSALEHGYRLLDTAPGI
jgi:2,5-diketo-D-gluconate reductase A